MHNENAAYALYPLHLYGEHAKERGKHEADS